MIDLKDLKTAKCAPQCTSLSYFTISSILSTVKSRDNARDPEPGNPGKIIDFEQAVSVLE